MISAVMSTALSGMRAQTERAADVADKAANFTRPETVSKQVVTMSRAGGVVTASTQQLAPPEAAVSVVAANPKVRTPKTQLPLSAEWPNPSVINLPSEIMDLVETQTAFRSSLAAFETGAEFWDMLQVAADPGHDRRQP
jgi:flagellar basal body rod protein FlgC